MKQLYVVRHCKAEGQEPEAKLTGQGLGQAEELASFLADKGIDAICSSPFERARRTVAPLAEKLGLDVRLDDRLSERVLCGADRVDWLDLLRASYDDLDLCYEGGESGRTAMSRAIAVVEDLLNSDARNIVVVSHGNLISLLLKYYDERIGFKEWEALTNPDVYQLTFSEKEPTVSRIWAHS
jgi:2,3-bisphosphoglycerate-dependent phosphoglycerate mutase